MLGSVLSDLDALTRTVTGKLVWFTGTGLWLCSAMALLRRKGRLSPVMRTSVLGLLVFAAGLVMIRLRDAWQAEPARSAS